MSKKKRFSARWIDHRFIIAAPNYCVAYSMAYDALRFKLNATHLQIIEHLKVGERK